MNVYSLTDGENLVKAARYSIELYLKSPNFDRSVMKGTLEKYVEKRGMFVTLEHYPTMALRGCVGFPKPSGSVGALLVEAAIAAAAEDPRFVPISHQELKETVIEVSILSDPEIVNKATAEARKREIKVGRDGLIVHYGFNSGLLLPIVAVEQDWDREEFLEGVCEKAGLPVDAWKRSNISLYKFTTQVFKETEPEGQVKEIHLG